VSVAQAHALHRVEHQPQEADQRMGANAVAASGYGVGVHCYDHIKWQDFVARKGYEWTRAEMLKDAKAFEAVFGSPPKVRGAAGWLWTRR